MRIIIGAMVLISVQSICIAGYEYPSFDDFNPCISIQDDMYRWCEISDISKQCLKAIDDLEKCEASVEYKKAKEKYDTDKENERKARKYANE